MDHEPTPRRAGPTPDDLTCSLLEIVDDVVAVLRFLRSSPSSPARPGSAPALTAAEEIVMQGIFEGKSNDEIARVRGTSPRTIANQIASIFKKHGVTSRRELVARYLDATPSTAPDSER